MSLLEDIKNGTRLPSYKFSFREHCSMQGETPLDLWDFERGVPINGWKYVGWCPSESTAIQKSNWGDGYPIAVLLEDEHGVTTWCHVRATDEMTMEAFRICK